jgi:transcriptional regulator with XRE-family HTH domain
VTTGTSRRERINIAPAVLRWARESAGFDLPLAAKRLRIKSEALGQWESGSAGPTISQLRRAAEVYKRPLAVLLLPIPLQEQEPPRDFRATERRSSRGWTPELRFEFRRAVSQREVFLEIRELSPESVPTIYEGLRVGRREDP